MFSKIVAILHLARGNLPKSSTRLLQPILTIFLSLQETPDVSLFGENGPTPKRKMYEEKMVKRLSDFHLDNGANTNAVVTDVTDEQDDW